MPAEFTSFPDNYRGHFSVWHWSSFPTWSEELSSCPLLIILLSMMTPRHNPQQTQGLIELPSLAANIVQRDDRNKEPRMQCLLTKTFSKKRLGDSLDKYAKQWKITINPVRTLCIRGKVCLQAGGQLPVGLCPRSYRLWKIHKQFRTKTFAERPLPHVLRCAEEFGCGYFQMSSGT